MDIKHYKKFTNGKRINNSSYEGLNNRIQQDIDILISFSDTIETKKVLSEKTLKIAIKNKDGYVII